MADSNSVQMSIFWLRYAEVLQKQELIDLTKQSEKKPGRPKLNPKPKHGKKRAKSEPVAPQKKKKSKKSQRVDKNQPSVASFFKKD